MARNEIFEDQVEILWGGVYENSAEYVFEKKDKKKFAEEGYSKVDGTESDLYMHLTLNVLKRDLGLNMKLGNLGNASFWVKKEGGEINVYVSMIGKADYVYALDESFMSLAKYQETFVEA